MVHLFQSIAAYSAWVAAPITVNEGAERKHYFNLHDPSSHYFSWSSLFAFCHITLFSRGPGAAGGCEFAQMGGGPVSYGTFAYSKR